jgi:MarR family transcriptional regulator, lower aerobic nicotinate degradation pathway regulator
LAISEARTAAGDDALAGFCVEDHIGYLLRRAHQRHVALFTAGLAHVELTPTQFTALLKTVEVGRITQNHLGRLAAMDPATIQGVVRRLEARGLVCRTEDPADRRTAVLEATPLGRSVAREAVLRARAITAATLEPLDSAERSLFLSLLKKLG